MRRFVIFIFFLFLLFSIIFSEETPGLKIKSEDSVTDTITDNQIFPSTKKNKKAKNKGKKESPVPEKGTNDLSGEEYIEIITQQGTVQLQNLTDRQIIIYTFTEITYRNLYFKADELIIERFTLTKETLIHGSGNVRLEDRENKYILICEKVDYTTKDENITATGNPVLSSTEKSLVIKGDKIRYFRDLHLAQTTGNADIVYEDYNGRGDDVKYYRKEDKIIITGHGEVKRKDGSFIKGDQISIFGRDTMVVRGGGNLQLNNITGLDISGKDKSAAKNGLKDSDVPDTELSPPPSDNISPGSDQETLPGEGEEQIPDNSIRAVFEFMELRDKDNKIYLRYGKISQGGDWIRGNEIFIDYYYPKKGGDAEIKQLLALGEAQAYILKDDTLIIGEEIELDDNRNIFIRKGPRIVSKDEDGKDLIITAGDIVRPARR